MFKKEIFQASAVLLLLFLMEWWLIYLSPLNLPEYIPHTPIRIDGLLLGATIIIVLIRQCKKLLALEPSISIFKLTVVGALTVLIAEVIFQLLRQFHINADTVKEHLYFFFLGTITVSLFSAVIAFLIAFQLKTKRTNALLLMIVLLLIGFHIVTNYLLK